MIETDDGDFLVKSKDSNFVEFIDEEMGDGTGDDEEMTEIVDGINSSVKLVECDSGFTKNAGYKYCLIKSNKGSLLKNLMNNLDEQDYSDEESYNRNLEERLRSEYEDEFGLEPYEESSEISFDEWVHRRAAQFSSRKSIKSSLLDRFRQYKDTHPIPELSTEGHSSGFTSVKDEFNNLLEWFEENVCETEEYPISEIKTQIERSKNANNRYGRRVQEGGRAFESWISDFLAHEETIKSSRKPIKSSRVDLFGESCLVVDTDYIDNHDLYFVDYVIDNDVVEWSVFRDDEDTYYAVKGEY